ncbi:MAG: hypothetical protein ACI9YE_001994 [Psychroserpens sp.]|jgi:hypothetical protein
MLIDIKETLKESHLTKFNEIKQLIMKYIASHVSSRIYCGFAIILFSLFFEACSNDDDSPQDPVAQLPPVTMTGENTFGFLLNGEPINITNTSDQIAIFQNGGLTIGGQNEVDGLSENLQIFISENNIGEPLSTNTNYVLNSDGVPKGEFFSESENCIYTTSNIYTGTLTINHIDNMNYTISGTFNFEAYSNTCSGAINITQGRFDLQYIP